MASRLPHKRLRPQAEGWEQELDAEGRPALKFDAPRGAKPPVHWADLTVQEREARIVELGFPKFRAKQISNHYFTHYSSDPATMTDPNQPGVLVRAWPVPPKEQ